MHIIKEVSPVYQVRGRLSPTGNSSVHKATIVITERETDRRADTLTEAHSVTGRGRVDLHALIVASDSFTSHKTCASILQPRDRVNLYIYTAGTLSRGSYIREVLRRISL